MTHQSHSGLKPVSTFDFRLSTFPRAFTMLELLVVIGIIGLLIAIAVPASTYLLERQRGDRTRESMDILKTAIGMFEQKKPLKDKYRTVTPIPYMSLYGDLPPDYFLWEPRPPLTPDYEYLDLTANDANSNKMWDPGIPPAPPETITNDQTNTNDEGYHRLNVAWLTADFKNVAEKDGVERLINGTWQPDPTPNASPVTENYRSIESLYLYLSRLCPECNPLLARLPDKIKTNSDVCSSGPCPERVIFGLKPGDPTSADNTKWREGRSNGSPGRVEETDALHRHAIRERNGAEMDLGTPIGRTGRDFRERRQWFSGF